MNLYLIQTLSTIENYYPLHPIGSCSKNRYTTKRRGLECDECNQFGTPKEILGLCEIFYRILRMIPFIKELIDDF